MNGRTVDLTASDSMLRPMACSTKGNTEKGYLGVKEHLPETIDGNMSEVT